MNTPEVVTFLTTLPILSIVSWLIVIIYIFFSFAITYHWVLYSRNIILTALVLSIYYGVSLFLIGLVVIHL